MAIDVFPDLQTALPAIVKLAQEDLGAALSHLATIEEQAITGAIESRTQYTAAYDAHRRSVDGLLERTFFGHDEYFALLSRGVLRVVDLRDPVINSDPNAQFDQRLSMGSRVTSFGFTGFHETRRGAIRFSAYDFCLTALTRRNTIGVLAAVTQAPNEAVGTFAGQEAIGFLGCVLGLPIEQVMEARPDYRPLSPRTA
jgi:hypothetical protein